MKKLFILLMTAAMLFSLCGCVWFMGAPDDDNDAPAGLEPVVDEPEITPEPEMARNPVLEFYSEYYAACGAMEELFQSRLEGEATKEAADTLIYLAEHGLMVSEGKITFGWLLSTDSEGTFSSLVFGGADGSGTISPGIDERKTAADEREGEEMELTPLMPAETPILTAIPDESIEPEEAYTLNFQFAAGNSLRGTLQKEHLEYSEIDGSGYSVDIVTEGDVWESTVIRGDGLTSVLRCDGNGLHFTVFDSADQSDITENIYKWTSDSAGARRI